MDLKEALKNKLSKNELNLLRKGFDSIGNIAIIEVPEELKKKQKLIAETLLKTHKNFRTIAKKESAHKNKYRIEKVSVIAGGKSLVADYKESGCGFKVSLGKVYFSPRLATERLRIARQVKDGENVGIFFAGVGPYCVVIAKHSKASKVYGFEWNPKAVKDFKENIARNKMHARIEAILGDVKKTAKKFTGEFDRIAMPAPSNSKSYLKTAFACCGQKAIIHYYCFSLVKEPFKKPKEFVEKTAKENGKKVKFLSERIVRPYSKTKCQIVLDLEVRN